MSLSRTSAQFEALLRKLVPSVQDAKEITDSKEVLFEVFRDRLMVTLQTVPDAVLSVLFHGVELFFRQATELRDQITIWQTVVDEQIERIRTSRTQDNTQIEAELYVKALEAVELSIQREESLAQMSARLTPTLKEVAKRGSEPQTPTTTVSITSWIKWAARYANLLIDLDQWVSSLGELVGVQIFTPLSSRVMSAIKSRTNRLRLGTTEEINAAEARELQAEIAAFKSLSSALNPPLSHFLAKRIGASDRAKLVCDLFASDNQPSSLLFGVGPYDLAYDSTLDLEVGGQPLSLTIPTSTDVEITSDTVLSAPAAGTPRELTFSFSLSPDSPSDYVYDAEIITPTAYLGGAPALGSHAHGYLCSDYFHGEMVGSRVSITRQDEDPGLSANDRLAALANEGTYRVVGFDGESYLKPVIKLDPPWPSGYNANIVSGWVVTRIPHTVTYELPADNGAYGSYIERVVAELNGADPSTPATEKVRPIQYDIFLAGTFSGTFKVGERVLNTNGTVGVRHGIVVGQSPTGVYILGTLNPPLVADDLEGYESGVTGTITARTFKQSYPSSSSNETSFRRWLVASNVGGKLRVRRRYVLGQGLNASLSDGALGSGDILTTSGGDVGFYELGLYPGSTVHLGGSPYVLSEIISETEARTTTNGLYAGAWEARQEKEVYSLQCLGVISYSQFQQDLTALMAGYPASGYESSPLVLRSVERVQYRAQGPVSFSTSYRNAVTQEELLQALISLALSELSFFIRDGRLYAQAAIFPQEVSVQGGTSAAALSILAAPAKSSQWFIKTTTDLPVDLSAIGASAGDLLSASAGDVLQNTTLQSVDTEKSLVRTSALEIPTSGELGVVSLLSAVVDQWVRGKDKYAHIPRLGEAAVGEADRSIRKWMGRQTDPTTQLQLSDLSPAKTSLDLLSRNLTNYLTWLSLLSSRPRLGSAILEGIRNQGYDRMADQLAKGKFTQVFLEGTLEDASYQSYLNKQLNDVGYQVGKVSTNADERPRYEGVSNIAEENTDIPEDIEVFDE